MRFACLLAVCLAGTALAEPARSGLSVRFGAAAAGDAFVDLGRVSGRACGFTSSGHRCEASVVTRRRIGVRVEGDSRAPRFIRLSAYLPHGGARVRVRVDGVVLGLTPRIIDAAAPLGVPVNHTIELEVPAAEPQGPLAADITWLVETE